MQVTPIPRDALVRAAVVTRSEKVSVVGVLLGRMTRVSGVAVAGEVEIIDDGYAGTYGRGRVTLVPAKDVVALNDAARELMRDAGPTVRAA